MKELTDDMLEFEYGEDGWDQKIDDNREKMEPVFVEFGEYLKGKNLKEKTVHKKVQMVYFFLFDFLYIYGSADSVIDVDEETIRTFLGNWYIRKFMNPNISEMRDFLNAITDFYRFLKKRGLMGYFGDIDEIVETCKDKKWFEMRLNTYFNADEDDFEMWIDEYNYDFF